VGLLLRRNEATDKEEIMAESFTIPVVLDPSYMEKLDEIWKAVEANQEAIVELKKIKTGTGLSIGVDLDEEVE